MSDEEKLEGAPVPEEGAGVEGEPKEEEGSDAAPAEGEAAA